MIEPDRPRKPVRANGIARYGALLDALERLLDEYEPDEVSLADVAAEADASTASAYHFFPSMAAAHVALVERYAERFVGLSDETLDPDAFESWQDIVRAQSRRGWAYYNEQPVALKLLFGPARSWAVRCADLEINRGLARLMVRQCRAVFELPSADALQGPVEVALEINDALWAMSCARHGRITEAYAVEAEHAAIAYLERYMPQLARRVSSQES